MNERLSPRGLVVLAFPCNQFAAQEPKTNAEIKAFATSNFGVTFPLFSKIDVNGANTAPVYAFLKRCFPGDVPWNFISQFVIDRDGVPVARFQKDPHDDVEKFVQTILDEDAQARAARRTALEKENGRAAASNM